MKTKAISVIAAATLTMTSFAAFAVTASADDKITITTEDDLKAIKETGNYVLENDITVTGDWTPITSFTGTLDGAGHTISGLTNTYGLIKANSGTVKNLTVSGTIDSINADNIGGVAAENGGTVENCIFAGSIVIENFDNNTVQGTLARVGGVVGYNNGSGTVTKCGTTGDGSISFSSTDNETRVIGFDIGGVVGFNNGGTVSLCYNTIPVSGYGNVGGVVGSDDSINTNTIEQCYNTGKVNGGFQDIKTGADDQDLSYAAGIVGRTFVQYTTNNGYYDVANCYNTGYIKGQIAAGITNYYETGKELGKIKNCYNYSAIGCKRHAYYTSDLNGQNMEYVYYKSEGSYHEDKTANTHAMSQTDFDQSENFTNWDFTNIWEINTRLGRPILQAIPEVEPEVMGFVTQKIDATNGKDGGATAFITTVTTNNDPEVTTVSRITWEVTTSGEYKTCTVSGGDDLPNMTFTENGIAIIVLMIEGLYDETATAVVTVE